MNNEQLKQEIERLEEQIKELKLKLEEKVEEESFLPYKPYEVEVPEDIDNYYYTDEYGKVDYLEGYNSSYEKNKYIRGLAFKTEEEAEQYDKERILLFKLHKWAEEHNGGWKPDWKDFNEEKYIIVYDYDCKKFYVYSNFYYADISKLPLFKTSEIAQQFIEEFGDEIKEVFC